jgi:hypothetical protein
MQRRGLGRLLLTTLVEAARERGIRRFRTYVLPDNEPVKLLIRSLDEHTTARIEDGLRVYDLALPEPSPEALSADPIYRFFKLVAEGVGTAIRSLSIPFKRRAQGRPPAQRDRDRPADWGRRNLAVTKAQGSRTPLRHLHRPRRLHRGRVRERRTHQSGGAGRGRWARCCRAGRHILEAHARPQGIVAACEPFGAARCATSSSRPEGGGHRPVNHRSLTASS